MVSAAMVILCDCPSLGAAHLFPVPVNWPLDGPPCLSMSGAWGPCDLFPGCPAALWLTALGPGLTAPCRGVWAISPPLLPPTCSFLSGQRANSALVRPAPGRVCVLGRAHAGCGVNGPKPKLIASAKVKSCHLHLLGLHAPRDRLRGRPWPVPFLGLVADPELWDAHNGRGALPGCRPHRLHLRQAQEFLLPDLCPLCPEKPAYC